MTVNSQGCLRRGDFRLRFPIVPGVSKRRQRRGDWRKRAADGVRSAQGASGEKTRRMRNADRFIGWFFSSFRGWDKFLVNAVCCHATKTISLYHDPILSAHCTSGAENVRRKEASFLGTARGGLELFEGLRRSWSGENNGFAWVGWVSAGFLFFRLVEVV